MHSLFVVLAAMAALVMVSVDGYAADYEMVGFTTATFDGDEGSFGFTAACQTEFSSDTRWCNSVEIMETVNLPSLGAVANGWVRPVLVTAEGTLEADASGMTVTTSFGLTCDRWLNATNTKSGLAFAGTGSGTYAFGTSGCNLPRAAACCGPVPAPVVASVPSMLWLGRGLLVAFMLSAAGAVYLFRSRPRLSSGRGDPSLRG